MSSLGKRNSTKFSSVGVSPAVDLGSRRAGQLQGDQGGQGCAGPALEGRQFWVSCCCCLLLLLLLLLFLTMMVLYLLIELFSSCLLNQGGTAEISRTGKERSFGGESKARPTPSSGEQNVFFDGRPGSSEPLH